MKRFYDFERITGMSTDELKLLNDVEQLKVRIALQSVVLAEREQAVSQRDIQIAQQIAQHLAQLSDRETAITQYTATITQYTATIAQHEAVIASQHFTIGKQQKKLEGLELQLARLLRRQYGPQKERVDASQLTLFTIDDIEAMAEELKQGTEDSVSTDDGTEVDGAGSANDESDKSSANASNQEKETKAKPKGHGRRPLPAHLPRETVVHELNDEERTCPCCGKPRKEIGRETSQQLEFVPASLKVIQHERVRYACDACEENVVVAPKPAQPINKGLPGPGLLAHVTLSKYGDYLPLYRQEDILSRSGIILRRSTLCDWVAAVADLLTPLYILMCQRVRQSHVIQTDDTGIKMLSEGQCQNCKMWPYVGDEFNPYVVYDFTLNRDGVHPLQFLKGFSGYLQADAYSGYDQVYSQSSIIEVACMAHCRRYWWEAKDNDSKRAHEAISYIGRLYQLEVLFEKQSLTGDALRDTRKQFAIPILDEFQIWLKAEQEKVLPKSLIGKAFTYTLNQWKPLCRYTEDGALSIDNSLAERMVKPVAIGRKNWLFVGSETGGQRAAKLLSIIGSAKYCEVEPWAWLNAVLKELPLRINGANPPDKPPDLTDLLPDVWLKNHPGHRWEIDDIRKVERERSKQQKANARTAEGR